jgi:mono/diheme cytochrome c family protein
MLSHKFKVKLEERHARAPLRSVECAARRRRQRATRLIFYLLSVAFLLLFGAACRQDMHDQPKYIPLRKSNFFSDGSSARPYVEGTIPRGYLKEDALLYEGKIRQTAGAPSSTNEGQTVARMAGSDAGGATSAASTPVAAAAPTQTRRAASNSGATGANTYGADIATTFPFPVTEELVKRGQERYQIFCSVCHGMTGEGDGMIVRRGYKRPPSYSTDQLRAAPVGHFFDVITNGWGTMPSYASQVPVHDRWAIVAYIRALQLSQLTAPGQQPQQGGANAGALAPNAPQQQNRSGGQR